MSVGLKPKIWDRLPSFGLVLRRFPVAVAAMAIFTIIIIWTPNIRLDTPLGRALTGVIIGGYLCVIITIAREALQKSRLYSLQALSVILAALLFWFSQSLRLNIVMALGAVLLMLGNAAGWGKARDDLHIWDFTHKLWTGAILAVVGSVIFLLGVSSIGFALKTLLGININKLTQDFIIPLGFGFLAPVYWLSTLPPADEPYDELYDNPGFVSKAIGFLGTWLLAPLSMIYAVIILLYGAKIAVTMELPKGEIAALTTPFLLIGTLTWLVLEPPFIQKTALARWFRWLWFPVSLPVTLLLAIATAVRISTYGYTEERFALALVVVWGFAVGIWFTIKKEGARDIRLIPGIGAGLLLAATFAAQPISINSQTLRAKAIVDELGLMTESGVLTAIKSPSLEQRKALQSLKGSLAYLYRQDSQGSIKRVFPQGSNIETAADVYDALDIEQISFRNQQDQTIIDFSDDNMFIDVSGFDDISRVFNVYIMPSETSAAILSKANSKIKVMIKAGDISVTHADGYKSKLDVTAAIKAMDLNFETPLFIDIDERTRLQFQSFKIQEDWQTGEQKTTRLWFRVLTKD